MAKYLDEDGLKAALTKVNSKYAKLSGATFTGDVSRGSTISDGGSATLKTNCLDIFSSSDKTSLNGTGIYLANGELVSYRKVNGALSKLATLIFPSSGGTLATRDYVTGLGYITSSALIDYATKSDVPSLISLVSSGAGTGIASLSYSNGVFTATRGSFLNSYTKKTALGGLKSYAALSFTSSDVWEIGINLGVMSASICFIRFGRFKQTSGSGITATSFSFKTAMTGYNNSTTSIQKASYVSVILGDSLGQSTNGAYMGSLAVDSASYSGFSYRASNGELGYVYYIAIGRY